ncbi:MAG: hypothetical protein ACOZAR_05270 [Patescibacteria group bacterium]
MERGLQKFEGNSFGVNVFPKKPEKPDFSRNYALPGLRRAQPEINNPLVNDTINYLLEKKEDVFSLEKGIFPSEMEKCIKSAQEELKKLSNDQERKNLVSALVSNISTLFPEKRYKGLNDRIGKSSTFKEILDWIKENVLVWQRIDNSDRK